MISDRGMKNATGFAVMMAFLFGAVIIFDGFMRRGKTLVCPEGMKPDFKGETCIPDYLSEDGVKRDTDNRVIVGDILYEETIDGRTFAIQERTIAGNSVDEVNGLYYVVGTISSGVFTPQMQRMSDADWRYEGYWSMTQSQWFRTYDEALAQIERMRPDDNPTTPQKPRPSPPNGGLGGLGGLGSGNSPETASQPSENPFPSGGSSGGVF